MRLTRSKKIATTAVCAAIAIICVVVARFVPVGWIALYAISGVVTLTCVRLCGYGYGLMAYLVTSLVSLSVFPYCWPYVMLFGLHAIVRELVYGKPPVRTVRRILGAIGIAVYFYGISVALLLLMGEVLGIATAMAQIGGPLVLAAIVAALLVVYDLGVGYLAQCLEKAAFPRKKRPPPDKSEQTLTDPFADSDQDPTDGQE